MDVEHVKKFTGQRVLIILHNEYKFTTTIPDFQGESFTITDRNGQEVSIDCKFIAMIYQKEDESESSNKLSKRH